VETLIGIGLAAAWLVSVWKAPRFAPGLLVAAVAFDLLPNFVCFNSHANPGILDQRFPVIDAIRSREKDPWRATGSLRLPEAPGVTPNPWNFSIGSNILALYGVEAVLGYESIAPLSTVLYCAKNGGPQSILGSGRVLMLDNPETPLTRVANLEYLLMPFEGYKPQESSAIGQWGALRGYHQNGALPRAYVVEHWALGDADLAADFLLRRTNFDPQNQVVLETTTAPNVGSGGGTVRWVSRETDLIELAVEAKADAILVVSDTDYPGWEADLDGVPTPILRANITFRAIAVPAGTHHIVMRFRPASARNGLIVTLLSMVAVLGYCGRRNAV
jgi:hypothetical protein